MKKPLITPAVSFAPLTADDLADIHQRFKHTPQSYAADERDLRLAARRPSVSPVTQPLTFALSSVLSGNTR